MKETQAHDLVEEALRLLASHADDPVAKQDALHSWAAQSDAHAQALKQAQLEWSVFTQLDRPAPGSIERLHIKAETLAAQVSDRPGTLLALCVLVLSLIATPFALHWTPDAPQMASAPITTQGETVSATVYATARGEQKSVMLADNSIVWLNWDTQIEVRFEDAQRHVDLIKGAALFSVTEDPERPFRVHVGNASATVLGTEFAVHKHGSDHITFEVSTGRVAVTPRAGGKAVELLKEQAITVRDNALEERRSIALRAVGAWRDGRLVFDKQPLSEALEEIGHYTTRPVARGVLADPTAPVSGTVFIDDADNALASLADVFGLTITAAPDGMIISAN